MAIEKTVSEIAEILGVSRQAVNNRVKNLPEEDVDKNEKGVTVVNRSGLIKLEEIYKKTIFEDDPIDEETKQRELLEILVDEKNTEITRLYEQLKAKDKQLASKDEQLRVKDVQIGFYQHHRPAQRGKIDTSQRDRRGADRHHHPQAPDDAEQDRGNPKSDRTAGGPDDLSGYARHPPGGDPPQPGHGRDGNGYLPKRRSAADADRGLRRGSFGRSYDPRVSP